MAVREISAPEWEPISLVDVKHVIAEDGDALDVILSRVWIPAARRQAEILTGWTFAKRQFRQGFAGFCSFGMKLRPPLISIEKVSYLDASGQFLEIAPSEYQVVPTSLEGLLLPSIGGCFPIAAKQPESVIVEFTAGYASRDLVPESAKQWMLMAIATWYQNREAFVVGSNVTELPRDFMAGLLDEFSLVKV